MPATTTHSNWSPTREGNLTENLRGLLASAVDYFEARWRLVKLEASDAVRTGLGLILVSVFAVVCLLLAYACSVVGLVLLVADAWWNDRVMPAAFTVAGMHLVLAVACGCWIAWAARKRKWFQHTGNEFQEEKRWLHMEMKSHN